jgi:hypothetical protein
MQFHTLICVIILLSAFCSHGLANDRFVFQRVNRNEVKVTKNDPNQNMLVNDGQIKIELVTGQDTATLAPTQQMIPAQNGMPIMPQQQTLVPSNVSGPRIAARPINKRAPEGEDYLYGQKSLGGIVTPSGSQSLGTPQQSMMTPADYKDLEKWRYLSRFPVNLQIVGDTLLFEWAGAQQRLKIPADGKVQLKLSPQ